MLGLIGGIAPESTIDYYRRLIAGYRARVTDGSYPAILVNSIDLTRMLGYAASDLDALTSYLTDELRRLADAGATLGAMASNTPHLVFDRVARVSPIPLVSIVEAARTGAIERGVTRAALLGTRFTMKGSTYPVVFDGSPVALVHPTPEEQDFIHEKYMGELVLGQFHVATRERILAILERLRRDEEIDGVLLAGTELPLLLGEATIEGVTFLDTTGLHVQAILDRLRSP